MLQVNCDECNDLDGWDESCDECLEEQCWPEFESCSGVVYGCDEQDVCNYEEGAIWMLSFANFPDNFNCDGECIEELDCLVSAEVKQLKMSVGNGDGSLRGS